MYSSPLLEKKKTPNKKKQISMPVSSVIQRERRKENPFHPPILQIHWADLTMSAAVWVSVIYRNSSSTTTKRRRLRNEGWIGFSFGPHAKFFFLLFACQCCRCYFRIRSGILLLLVVLLPLCCCQTALGLWKLFNLFQTNIPNLRSQFAQPPISDFSKSEWNEWNPSHHPPSILVSLLSSGTLYSDNGWLIGVVRFEWQFPWDYQPISLYE